MFGALFGSSSRPPVFLRFRSSKTLIILTVATAVFVDVFAYAVIVPVLPFALTTRSGISEDVVQSWISILLAVYGAALLVASPVCGYFADHSSSRRLPLLVGLLALAGSTIMLCIGNSIAIFVAGRILQGFSAAVVWVTGLALMVDTMGVNEVGVGMGYVGISMSLGILLAPLLGGIVFNASGYYAVFAMTFALIVVDILLRLIMIEKKVALKWLPPAEAEVAVDGVKDGQDPCLGQRQSAVDIEMDPTSPANNEPCKSTGTLPTETMTDQTPEHAAGLQAPREFIDRLPPVLYLCTSRRVLSSLWACIIQASLLTAFDTILPLFVAKLFHWNSLGAGLIFLPIVVTTFLGPVVGHFNDKYGPRYFATAGFIISCPCLILLRLVDHDSIGQKVLLCALLTLIGLNLTLILTPIMAEVTYAVDAKAARKPPGFFGKNGAYAQAYSLFNMGWAAGSMIGPLLAGLVNQHAGWGVATLILGIISLVTAVPTVIWTGGSLFKLSRRRKEAARASEAGLEQA